jgi:DNA-binding NarL/FixJ family response regulator
MIRILLVDDQNLICEGLKAMLSLEDDLEIIGIADNGEKAVKIVSTLQPDVVLMDMRMPVMDGKEATGIITKNYPNTKVIVLTTFDDDEYISDAISAGAKGYLLKDMPLEELVQAIKFVDRGYTQLGPGMLEKLLTNNSNKNQSIESNSHELSELTPRERDVLHLIAKGFTNREIAGELYITEGTVKTHVTHLLTRLNLRNRAQIAIFASSLKNAL